jgi:hypothetical protein
VEWLKVKVLSSSHRTEKKKKTQKLKIELPYDPVIPLLGIYPKELKTGYNRDTWTLMFIKALFTIAKLWK